MSASVLQIFVMRDGQLVASEVFAEGLYTLGSEPDCDLVLLDPAVAGVHASLQFQGGLVELTDNESQTGLVINGQAVPSAQIRSSDDVRVGPFLIKTRVVGKKPALKPAAKPSPGSLPPPPARTAPLPPAPVSPPRVAAGPVSTPFAPQAPPAAATSPARPPALPAPRPPPPGAPPANASAMPRFAVPAAPATTQAATGTARPVLPAPPRPPAPSPALPPSPQPSSRPPPTGRTPGAAPNTTSSRPMAPLLRSVPPPTPDPIARPAPRPPAARAAIAAVPELEEPLAQAAPLASEDLLDDIDFLFDQALERHASEAAPQRPRAAPSGANRFGGGVVELSAEAAAEAHAPPPPPPVALAPAAAASPRPAPPAPRPTPPRAPDPITLTPPAPPPAVTRTPEAIPVAAASALEPLPAAVAEAAPPAAKPKASKSVAASGGLQLHARFYWGDSLLHARSFGPEVAAFSAPGDGELLATYGFAQTPGAPLVRSAGSAWTIAPPADAQAFTRALSGRGWVPAAPSGAKEVRLDSGGAIRLARGPFQLELSAPAAPVKITGQLLKQVDLTVVALLLLVGTGLFAFVNFLPPAPLQHPQEKEVVVQVQARIREEPPRPKKPPKPVDAPPPERQAPAPIAQATTLKAAGAPLKSLEKITKATRGLSNLLASLDAAGAKGGKKSNIAMIPTLNRAPGETAGMGGFGPCCAIGPITKGAEQLKSGGGSLVGALTGATAGQGGVSGVPVSMPARQAKVLGTYDRDALAKVINEHLNEIRACYERALLRNPDLGAGKVQLEWTISVDGSVGKVGAKVVTIKSNEVVSCLLETIKDIKFPRPTGGEVIVGYPVLFNSVGG